MAVRDTFNLVAEEFATNANADAMLTLAAKRLNPIVFQGDLELAVAYLAAHMLALSTRAAGGAAGVGPVTGERAGEVSRNYGMSNFGDKNTMLYGSTIYGIEFLNIVRSRAGTKMFNTSDAFPYPR